MFVSLARAFARDALGSGYMHDRDDDVSALEPAEDLVSMQELVELIGARKRVLRDAVAHMGAPTRRTRRGVVLPIAWVRAHSRQLFALKPKRRDRNNPSR